MNHHDRESDKEEVRPQREIAARGRTRISIRMNSLILRNYYTHYARKSIVPGSIKQATNYSNQQSARDWDEDDEEAESER